MNDVLGYADKKVVITGAATGMGAAAAELLVDLGAEVHALDIADVKAPIHADKKFRLRSRRHVGVQLSFLFPARPVTAPWRATTFLPVLRF